MENARMITGDDVRRARIEAGFTQETLAEACLVSRRTIQNVEAGGTPSVDTLQALRTVLPHLDASVSKMEDELDRLIDRHVQGETPEEEWKAAFRQINVGAGGMVLGLVLTACSEMVPKGILPFYMVLAVTCSIISVGLVGFGFKKAGGFRNEHDVDVDRAALREHIRRNGTRALTE
jgi:transcriptional regulator with XRE-family HTH domain